MFAESVSRVRYQDHYIIFSGNKQTKICEKANSNVYIWIYFTNQLKKLIIRVQKE
jgi:hypothetical protein